MTEPESFPWAPAPGSGIAAGTIGTYELLNDTVESRSSLCLNLDADSTPLSSILSESGGKLISDADEQLLFNFVFNQCVKVCELSIQSRAF